MKKPIALFFVIFLFLSSMLSVAQEFPAEPETGESSVDENSAAPAGANLIEEIKDEILNKTGMEGVLTENRAGTEKNESVIDTPKEDDKQFIQRIASVIIIIASLAALIWLIWFLFSLLTKKIDDSGRERIKPLVIKKLKILTTKQIISIIHALLRLLKYFITVFMLFLTVPVAFSFFPSTKELASTMFNHILTPIKNITVGTVKYIPNLITIIIIIVITHYVLRGIKFFSTQIENGKLILHGFYADWAAPTYRILQVLLWAFTVAIIYPYLPGSDSKSFQGVSVFIGIIFSLGSSSAIGNLVAGLVITYMRPFKIGDRVEIKDITGFVVEKTLMVVRLKTHKNEYVTFPNLLILGSSIINYNTSSDEDEEGLILHTEITFGYSTPWQTIHEILINAALATEYILKRPKPFVLQTKLDDFYACYQINCYTKEVGKVPGIYAGLYENIQNGFKEAGLDMTTPHYEISIGRKEKTEKSG
ncbi:MAG: mechanosensitive ion channel family protein [Spirochaetes bacterium]|nr:mechanosensitive ion channel family protein [Spirochaetota bacterium]